MNKVALCWLLLLLVGCGTAVDSTPRPTRTSIEDLVWVDTLREIDERSAVLVATAKFDAARPEFRTFADVVGHEHRKRTDAIDRWRKRSFDPAPKVLMLPACATEWRMVPARSADTELVAAMIEQRDCMLAYAEEARTNVQSPELGRIFADTIRTLSGELQQLRAWSATWTK